MGNVGRPPERYQPPQGDPIVTFTVAVARGKDKDPIWFKCKAFGKQGEIAEKYVTKGKTVGVSGTLDVEDWKTQDGTPRYTLCLVGAEVTLGPGGDQQQSKPAPSPDCNLNDIFNSNEEVPF